MTVHLSSFEDELQIEPVSMLMKDAVGQRPKSAPTLAAATRQTGLPLGSTKPTCVASTLDALLERTGHGDRDALKQFYDATSTKVFGTVLRILGDRQEAEDVLQDVYLSVWRHAAKFDATRAGAMTWLITIARNRAVDRIRARRGRSTTSLDAALEIRDPSPSADYYVDAGRQVQRLTAALATLDPRHVHIVRSAYFEGLTYVALAAREGVPVGTLKARVRSGLKQLRTEMTTNANYLGMVSEG